MSIYRYFVDNTNPRSLNYGMRRKRLQIFLSQIANCERPVSILDVGGSVNYWENLFFSQEGVERKDFSITITNIDDTRIQIGMKDDDYYNLDICDAREMKQYSNNQFDVVHSNSVIEHVGGFEDQKRMAHELRRVGKQHFVQTPNFYFPIEPHFKALFFHWLPKSWRIFLVRARKMGHLPKAKDMEHACEIVESAQLRRENELRQFFPESVICAEKFMGLTKSFIIMGQGY